MKKRIVLLLLAGASFCFAQEPTFMDAATHPGAGKLYLRMLLHAGRYEASGDEFNEQTAVLKLAYGIVSPLALLLDGEFRQVSDGMDASGFSRFGVRMKYRFFRKDMSPLNTWRASVMGGVAIPGSNKKLSQKNPHPLLGAVTTAILGRHGLNAQVEWEGFVDDPDVFSINASHLFRLAPAVYAVDTRGAWYTMLECLNDINDKGDSRSDLAVGLLYEAWQWAAEVSVRLPVADDHWPKQYDYEVGLGVRYLF